MACLNENMKITLNSNYTLFQIESVYSYDAAYSKIGTRSIEKCFELIETFGTLKEAKEAQYEFEKEHQLNTIIIPTY